MKGGLNVVLADENWLVRLGVTSLLSNDEQFGQIIDVGSGSAVVSALQKHEVHVLITDTDLPDISGIELCRQTRRDYPNPQVLFFEATGSTDGGDGHAGGRTRLCSQEQRSASVAGRHQDGCLGWPVLDAAVSDIVLDWMRRAATSGRSADRITDNERRILPLIAQGKTNREIAAELYLSEHAVKTYISALLKKLQLARRSEAAAYVARLEHVHSS